MSRALACLLAVTALALAVWWWSSDDGGSSDGDRTRMPAHLPGRENTSARPEEDDVVESPGDGGTTVVEGDADNRAASEQASVTRPLTAEEVTMLVAHLGRMLELSVAGMAGVEAQPPSVEREIRIRARQRNQTLYRAAIPEAQAGQAFQVVEGGLPRHDGDWHMCTMPRPDKEKGWWVVPLDKRKYPEVELQNRAWQATLDAKDNDYCAIWNRLPYERRRSIVEAAERAERDREFLDSHLRVLREMGVPDSPEAAEARSSTFRLEQVVALRPLGLSSSLEAVPSKTRFNARPPDR